MPSNRQAIDLLLEKTPEALQDLAESVALHEGYRSQPYQDHLGFWTIGFGTNIDKEFKSKKGLDHLLTFEGQVARFLTDLRRSRKEAKVWVGGNWKFLTPDQQDVISEMFYQLGATKMADFKNTQASLQDLRLQEFSSNALDSLWASQTPKRAQDLTSKFDSELAFVELPKPEPEPTDSLTPLEPGVFSSRDGQLFVLHEKGPQGVAGPQGASIKGDQGPEGPQGPKGDTGPVGPSGKDGKDGLDGSDGKDGKDGKKGEKGDRGPVGPAGSTTGGHAAGGGSTITHFTVTGFDYTITRGMLNGGINIFRVTDTSSPVTITLPSRNDRDKIIYINDESGNAGTNNITVTVA